MLVFAITALILNITLNFKYLTLSHRPAVRTVIFLNLCSVKSQAYFSSITFKRYCPYWFLSIGWAN